MKKIFLVLALFLASTLLWADFCNPTPEEMKEAKIISNQGIADPGLPTGNTVNATPEILIEEINTNKPPEHFVPLWADDLLVTNECNISANKTTLAFDYDADGNVYVAILSNHTGNDTLFVFRSTDKGYSWEKGWAMAPGLPCDIINYDMKVQHLASDPYIYTAVLSYNASNDTIMSYRRIKVSGTSFDWFWFSTDSSAFQNINQLSMDITEETNPHIYIVFSNDAGHTHALSSADGGALWNRDYISNAGGSFVNVSTGPGDYVYFVYYRTDYTTMRIGIYDNYLTSYVAFINASGARPDSRWPVIASSRTDAYPGNHVYLVYQDGYVHNNATRSYFSSSTDGGSTWTMDNYFLLGDIHAIRPFIAFSHTNSAVTALVTRYGTFDTLRYAYKSSQGGSWTSEGVVNQYRATTSITPQGNYIQPGVGGGIAVVYRQFGNNNIWYDRASHANSVEEEIISTPLDNANITINSSNLFFSVSITEETFGKIQIFDLTGREVAELFNGKLQSGENNLSYDLNNISSGNYIFLLTTPEKIISEKFYLFR